MNKEINTSTLCTGVYDEQANDKGKISQFLSHTSGNASGSVLYLCECMNARRFSLRKHPFLLALRRWGLARRNVCDSATEIPY